VTDTGCEGLDLREDEDVTFYDHRELLRPIELTFLAGGPISVTRLKSLETRHRMPLLVDHCQGVGITEHEASVVEHDGPPPGLSAVVAVDDYSHAGQVAEVLDDDTRLGR
jgi:hypothetical protein